jgi:RsiW-degrading membrane proteinase PrsW (M82 family)
MKMLLQLSLAPSIILVIFIYCKDKYEKEPIRMMLVCVIFGFLTASFVGGIDRLIAKLTIPLRFENLFDSYVASAGTEESMKLLFLYFLMKRNKNLNEPFDACLYASLVSLGFATIENIIYVFGSGSFTTAMSRAVFSVPGHFLFGITMGSAFAYYSYYKKGKVYLLLSFLLPYLAHGTYNFIILSLGNIYLLVFIPYLILLWKFSLSKMKLFASKSPFRQTKH